MNLNKLFPIQKELDEKIIEKKGLEEENLLPRKTVALICELYECVNEARFFKYWSDNQKPTGKTNVYRECGWCDGSGVEPGTFETDCSECDGEGDKGIAYTKYPLLEEYVDLIHFAISVALDFGITEYKHIETKPKDLNQLVLGITNLATIIPMSKEQHHVKSLLNNVITLGYQLGFSEKEVIDAYMDKNKENHKRQEVGY